MASLVDGLTKEEIVEYLYKVYDRLMEHRYRYYVLADPVIDDWEHDWIEREYNKLAIEYCVKEMDMVDFDPEDPFAIEAKKRVDSGTDYHSLWEKEMKPIWDKLGRSKKDEKRQSDRKERNQKGKDSGT